MTIDLSAIAWGIAVTGFIGCVAYVAYEFITAPLVDENGNPITDDIDWENAS